MDEIPMLQEQWERDWRRPNEELQRFATASRGWLRRGGTARVSALDAATLDAQVEELLADRLRNALARVATEDTLDTLRPELTALLRAAIFAATVARRGSSYGADLQNVSWRLSALQRTLHCCLSVGLPYLWARIEREAGSRRWWEQRSGVWKAMRVLETAVRVGALANFLVFLVQGRYPTLVSRLVCAPAMVPANAMLQRRVLYDQMNRQLFWEGFSELAVLALPLLRAGAVRRRIARVVTAAKRVLRVGQRGGSSSDAALSKTVNGGVCSICGAAPVQTPHRPTGCRHACCYHCIFAALAADPTGCVCSVCGSPVTAIVRVSAIDIAQ